MPPLPAIDPSTAHLITALLAAAVAVAAALGAWSVRGTTAVPAAAWAVGAAVLLAALEARAIARPSEAAAAATARLVVAAVAVCPAMSLLGAKRPQHGVWQVIVGSLAVVLAMPAVSAALVRPGSMPSVHLLGRGFLLVLVLAGWVNFLGTRKLAAATLVTLGLLLLVRPFLPGVDTATSFENPWGDLLGAAAVAGGAAAAVLARPAGAAGDPITAAFVPLRETIGAAWTLRIAERFNAIAEARGWPCRLSLAGLEAGGDPDDTAWQGQAWRVFQSLMRRFVSRDWLARHEISVEEPKSRWHARGGGG